MNSVKRIRATNTKSPLVRQYALTVELLKNGQNVEVVGRQPCKFTVDERSAHLYFTAATCQAHEQIHAIPGIVKTITRQYEINVEIAAAFDWKDIHPKIITILKNVYFGGGDVELDVPYTMPAFYPRATFDEVFTDEPGYHLPIVQGVSLCPYCVLVNDEKTPKASLLSNSDILCLHCNRISSGPASIKLLDYFGTTPSFKRMIGILTSQLIGNIHIVSEPAFSLAKKGGQNYEYWLRRITQDGEELLFTKVCGGIESTCETKPTWSSESDSLDLKLRYLGFTADPKDDSDAPDYRVHNVLFRQSWSRINQQERTLTRLFLYRKSAKTGS